MHTRVKLILSYFLMAFFCLLTCTHSGKCQPMECDMDSRGQPKPTAGQVREIFKRIQTNQHTITTRGTTPGSERNWFCQVIPLITWINPVFNGYPTLIQAINAEFSVQPSLSWSHSAGESQHILWHQFYLIGSTGNTFGILNLSYTQQPLNSQAIAAPHPAIAPSTALVAPATTTLAVTGSRPTARYIVNSGTESNDSPQRTRQSLCGGLCHWFAGLR